MVARGTKNATDRAKQDFIRGRTNRWSTGGYGATVHVWAEGGELRIRWTRPTRHQRTCFHADTRELRQELVDIAVELAEEIRSREDPRKSRPRPARITWRDVWLTYIRDRWPQIPDSVISGGRAEAREYYRSLAALPEEVRSRIPSPRTLLSVIQVMNRVSTYEKYRLDRCVDEAQPADWQLYTIWRMSQRVPNRDGHYQAGTVETDRRKLRAAIQHCMKGRPQWWGGRPDPLAGVKMVKSEAKVAPPELGEETAQLLMTEMRKNLRGTWRAYASLGIGMETGRRISEIGPDTLGFGTETLCLSDFHRGEDGRLYVTFRASVLKARNFGRGDLMIPATRGLEVIVRWLTRYHPNPLGPDAPLIWTKSDPSRPVSYAAVSHTFSEAWRATHDGQDPPKGLRFHGVCRTVITTLVDSIGSAQTAGFVGRTVATVDNIYKRIRPETQIAAADTLDRIRGRQPRAS